MAKKPKPKPAMGEQARTALRLVVGGGPAAAGALPAAAPALEPNRPEPAPAADGGERLPIGVSAAAAPGWRRIVRELERARQRAELDTLRARNGELEAENAWLRGRLEAAHESGRAAERARTARTMGGRLPSILEHE